MKPNAICLTTLCLLVGSGSPAYAESGQLPLEELRVFTEVFGKIKSDYVDSADDAALLRDAIQGMLTGLDPHSSFLDPQALSDMRLSGEGKYNGLGFEITIEDGFIRVIAPIDDTPAQRAGIQPGDLIIMLDGVVVQDLSVPEAMDALSGAPGTEIVLTISRPGEPEAIEVALVRAVIKASDVKNEIIEDGYGYLRVASFHGGTGANLRAAIEKLEQKNGRALNGVVLDLRNNPGGVLHGAVEVADVFVDAGVIVSTRGRNAADNRSYNASADDLLDGAPLVVLVNGGSASASEIVAGALQDHKRAIIMGTRTFGKGSVQNVIPIDHGGALKLTTARYYTPSNRSIQARGIIPDIIVTANTPAADQTDAWEIREADLAGHLENDPGGEAEGGDDGSGEGSGDDTKDDTKEAAEPGRAARDYQVGEALNLLKGMSLVRLQGQGSAKPVDGEG